MLPLTFWCDADGGHLLCWWREIPAQSGSIRCLKFLCHSMSFYPLRYMHVLSFPFGIHWDVKGRTVENCPHVCLRICYTVWFYYSGSLIRTTRVLVRHLSFVAHVRQKHDISEERKSPTNRPSSLCSKIPFRRGAPVPQLPLQILFEVHQVAILACYHQSWMHEALIRRAAAAS